MFMYVMAAIIWFVALVCIPIMKKIQPDCWIPYAIWAVFVASAFTAFAVLRDFY